VRTLGAMGDARGSPDKPLKVEVKESVVLRTVIRRQPVMMTAE
jgi:hypothetical protein